MNLRALATTACLVAFVTGCTTPTATTTPETTPTPITTSPTSSQPRPSQTPSPSATWSVDQQAAIDAVNGYSAVSLRIGSDPSKYTEKQMTAAFKQYSGGDMVRANVASYMRLRDKGWHYEGDVMILSLKATKAVDNHNARGLEVHVTACRDQTSIRITDSSGSPARTEQPPKFNLRQYSVRRPGGSAVWRVYGIATVEGRCGS